MRQKMITLSPTTWEHAAKMRNFSGWIREQLRYREQGFEIKQLLEELDHFERLISAIAMGEKMWKQGVGWVDSE